MTKPSSDSRRPHAAPRRLEPEATMVLLYRARSGDAGALNDLCARYLPRLQRWAHGRLPSWSRGSLDTHDVVQETLFHVIQRLENFDPRHDAAFQAYLRQALFNRIRDEIRRANRRPAFDELDAQNASSDPSPLEQAIGQEAAARYERALQRLRPEEREAIITRVEMGCPYSEVAEALGKPSIAAAYMAVSRALMRLAEEMARDGQT